MAGNVDSTYIIDKAGANGLVVNADGSINALNSPSATSSAASAFRNIALSNTVAAIKSSSGRLLSAHLFNPGVSIAYVHFYDLAAGSVVVGTTTPIYSIPLPSTATSQVGDDWTPSIPLAFGTAISIAASTTPSGGTAPSTSLVVSALYI